MSERDELIGKSVAKLRGELSQKEVADRMKGRGWKWSQATVWSVEKGDRPLRLAEAHDLAAVLNVSVLHFTRTPPVVAVDIRSQELATAHDVLIQAVKSYRSAQFRLATAADDAQRSGERLPADGELVLNRLEWTIEDVVRSVRARIAADERLNDELLVDRRRKREVIRGENGAPIPDRLPAQAHRYLDHLMSLERLHDGEHSEAP